MRYVFVKVQMSHKLQLFAQEEVMLSLTRWKPALFSLLLAAFILDSPARAEAEIEVWKSPTCGCCQAWVDYMRDNGFEVIAYNTEEMVPVKLQLGLTDRSLFSCHTALVDGYVIEGHVPARDIRRLLTERPDVVGLTAPGMPKLSPGMASIEPQDYDVLSFTADQQVAIFSRY